MRNQENTIDLCLSAEEMKAYLAESLSKEDAGLIDTHLADCELCCDSLEALTELGAELDLTMTEATFKDELKELPASVKVGKVFQLRRWWAVAASIALLFATYLIWDTSQSQPDKLFEAYFSPYEDLLSARSATEGGPEQLEKAMMAYNNGQYEIGKAEFESFLGQNSDNGLAHLYYGICLLALDDGEPIDEFEAIIQDYPALENVAKWYLALSLIRDEKFETAKEVLVDIEDAGAEFSDEASGLLHEMP